jgi:CPA2 family monovalent cation:H+ antiporter-2
MVYMITIKEEIELRNNCWRAIFIPKWQQQIASWDSGHLKKNLSESSD